MQAVNPRRGYILGLSAYLCWGLFPLYFKAIQNVPSIEIIVQRVLWSAVFASLVLVFGERLDTATIITFAFIWTGLVVYSVDAWLYLRRRT